ncbi:GntR family transcriptional regulator [Rhodobacter sp. Har01]|uniref:GntR family transcriptional regulator n=1 Tax=Rhodobacter sp. Har01 TaxID=2883999 RepID=UPI001D089762|nr:GntR family transcriptional regulator [Rhodobacter sp. Har01]MCB6179730.1 GntR family transcriptional regulator [Rhodobacter sp. Har01]
MPQDTQLAEVLHRFGPLGLIPGTPQSAAARALESLRQRIISMDLPPDTVLSRGELAAEYHVSQTPLREALQKLETEGLVDIYPQSRTVVTRIDAGQIREAHFLRLAVETEVLRRLAETADAALIGRLKTLLALQEALAGNPSEITAFQEMDELFHQTLMAGAGQPGLYALLRSRSGHLNRLRRLDLPGEGKIRHILDGHRAIVAALEAHDPQAAQEAIRGHLSQTLARLDLLRDQHPQFFSA